jgi:hypothetical protein
VSSGPINDDATMVDGTLVDATIVDATKVDANRIKGSAPQAAGISAGEDEKPPEGARIAPPAPSADFFFKRRGKILALAGATVFLVMIVGMMLFSGPSDPDDMTRTPTEPGIASIPDVPAPTGIPSREMPGERPMAKDTAVSIPDEPPTGGATADTAALPPSPASSFLEALAAVGKGKPATDFSLWTDRQTYRIGDAISFYFETGRPCYALILGHTTDGELVQIFPNHYSGGQFIQPGRTYSIPDDRMDFDLKVYGSVGQETVIALVADQPFQIFGSSFSETEPFLSIGQNDARASQLITNISAIRNRDIAQQRMTFTITN